MNLERGRKRDFPLEIVDLKFKGIDTYLPQEGPETYLTRYLGIFCQSIVTYLPREGTETQLEPVVLLIQRLI